VGYTGIYPPLRQSFMPLYDDGHVYCIAYFRFREVSYARMRQAIAAYVTLYKAAQLNAGMLNHSAC